MRNGSKPPGPGPELPAAQLRALSEHSGHPGAAADNPRRTLWRWSASRAPSSAASNEAPAGSAPHRVMPRHLANLIPRFEQRAELRNCARHALQTSSPG